MTHDEIAAFLMIVSCGSISSAAEKLYISQPALSNRIRLLEEDLGYELIKRRKGSRSLELTAEGIAFLPLARKNDRMWKQAKAIPQTLARDSLRISAVFSVSDYIMPKVLNEFCGRYPNVNLNFAVCHSYESYNRIESGDADIAFVSPEMYSKAIHTLPAFRAAMVCVTAPEALMPERISMSSLSAGDEIRLPWSPEYDNWHDNYFSGYSKPFAVTESMRSLETLISGSRWALAPQFLADDLVRHGKVLSTVDDPPPDQRVFCLIRHDAAKDYIRAFLSCFDEVIREMPGITSYIGSILEQSTL